MSSKPRRTKEQKMQAQTKRQDMLSYSYQAPTSSTQTSLVAQSRAASEKPEEKNQASEAVTREIFGYDVRLVYKDLAKTIMITVVIIVLLLGIFFFGGHHF